LWVIRKKYGEKKILEKIEILKAKKSFKKTPASFLAAAIRDNYTLNKKSDYPYLNFDKSEEEKAKRKKEKQASDNRIQQYIDSLTDELAEQYRDDFIAYLESRRCYLVEIELMKDPNYLVKKSPVFREYVIIKKLAIE